ncbi:SHOCT domain-containing protein [Pseudonocardia broussonetiae]|uniref:SHOCT domain-containing protein n=1 Tax=Pseudonocardia broussonetiae TaxID=2736640 RepID=A0A6M6JM76_9PSEU|nr:SHOCT domain-containing protein [Pseudonocardia broussonetiae]QJY49194.1 SHOCT domain-containing protein [Pseudonocardia broussonetiae]
MSFWDLVLTMFWFMLLFAWIGLLISIFGDIMRDHRMSGWAKAGWTLFLLLIPWLGALVYLIVRGRSMNERAAARESQQREAFDHYVRETARTPAPSTAEEIGKLADLRDRGTLTTEEFAQAKAKALGAGPAPARASRHEQQAVPAGT